MKLHGVLALTMVIVAACGASYWYFSHAAFPPKSNVCFEMLVSSLDAARSNSVVIVPDFSIDSLRYVRCTAIPGMTHFTIAGIDSFGKEFRIYETIGGRAASGADSIFDYCYTQNGKVVSGTRITGREGKRADSVCTYDAGLLPHSAYSYEYGIEE